MKSRNGHTERSPDGLGDIILSQEKFRALFHVSQEINQINDIESLLHEILDLSIANIDAERGLVILVDDAGEIYHAVASDSLDEKEITFSRSIVGKTLKNNEILLSIDVKCDERFKDSDSIKGLNILSFVCVPLIAPNYSRPIGTLYVDQRIHKKIFSNDDIAFLKAFANLAAIAIVNAKLTERLRSEKVHLLEEVGKKYNFPSVVGQGKTIQQVLASIKRIMNDNCTVLITGESGTGKEVVAKAMHYNGVRRDNPFVAINCGALPETLLEAELFGSVRGAFTGAVDKMGLLQAAQGGTVFLDEIHHTSTAMQIKLLRVLQEREVLRVGGTKPIKIDARLICATNEDLQDAIQEGRFRRDFYYRINVVTIDIPSLRERREDIPALAQYFLEKFSNARDKKLQGFDKPAMDALMKYDWRENNVRELENEIERAVIFAKDGAHIGLSDLTEKVRGAVHVTQDETTGLLTDARAEPLTHSQFEQKYIRFILSKTDGNVSKAARLMAMPRSTLMGKINKYCIK